MDAYMYASVARDEKHSDGGYFRWEWVGKYYREKVSYTEKVIMNIQVIF